MKNDFEFFVLVVENPQVTSSSLLFPFFFLLFFFRPWKLTAHTRSITLVVESAASASSLNLRDNLHREQRGEKATAPRQRSACGRFSTMSLTHFGRSRCHCNIRIAWHSSPIALIRFPTNNQAYFARGRTICENWTAWSSFVMITMCSFILFSTRSFVISDWTILVFISRSWNILQRFERFEIGENHEDRICIFPYN